MRLLACQRFEGGQDYSNGIDIGMEEIQTSTRERGNTLDRVGLTPTDITTPPLSFLEQNKSN